VTTSDFVTREEFEAFKRAQEERLTPMAVRLEVVSFDTTRLLRDVADLSERVDELAEEVAAFRQAVNGRFDAVGARFERLEKQIADGNAALLSAILQLSAP
jgi:hypothetical protein